MSDAKAFENEYISRREAIKARKRSCDKNCLECDFAIEGDSWCNGEVFVVDLLRIPAADVRPVRRGKWIDPTNGDPTYCSVCGEDALFYLFDFDSITRNGMTAKSNFCPNCGADMREES